MSNLPPPLALNVSEFPAQLADFTIYLRFAELQNRIARTRKKFGGLRAASEELRRRFAFSTTLEEFYNRRRLNRPPIDHTPRSIQAASAIATINTIRKSLSEKGQHRFRSSLLDAMSPDRDFREIEHELRVYAHLRQKGFSVVCADLEGVGRYDFLATAVETQAEVECKTVSSDIGQLVKIERSLDYFEALRAAILDIDLPFPSGVVDIRLDALIDASIMRDRVLNAIAAAHANTLCPSQSGMIVAVSKRDWAGSAGGRISQEVVMSIASEREQADVPHSMILTNRGGTWLFNIGSPRPTEIVSRINRIVSGASEQLSGNRPSVVWLHMLGLSEVELRRLSQESQETGRTGFTRVGMHAFSSELRDHVVQLHFSADADAVSTRLNELPASRSFSIDGPIYELTNRNAKFTIQRDL